MALRLLAVVLAGVAMAFRANLAFSGFTTGIVALLVPLFGSKSEFTVRPLVYAVASGVFGVLILGA